jgi:hypothetical protein
MIKSWSDFLAETVVVRPMIGISPDAGRAAQAVLSHIEAHVVLAMILRRSV